jgi:hypothetical protein
MYYLIDSQKLSAKSYNPKQRLLRNHTTFLSSSHFHTNYHLHRLVHHRRQAKTDDFSQG